MSNYSLGPLRCPDGVAACTLIAAGAQACFSTSPFVRPSSMTRLCAACLLACVVLLAIANSCLASDVALWDQSSAVAQVTSPRASDGSSAAGAIAGVWLAADTLTNDQTSCDNIATCCTAAASNSSSSITKQ
jgi:hypothetical protein